MRRFPPEMDPKIYTFAAALIGFALIDNLTANEQNGIGGWFMLLGQTLETNSGFQYLNEERYTGDTINTNSEQFKSGGSAFMKDKGQEKHPYDNREDIARIQRVLDIMQEEINKLKK